MEDQFRPRRMEDDSRGRALCEGDGPGDRKALCREKLDLVTATSYQFTVDVSVALEGSPVSRRVRAVVDISVTPPELIRSEDLSVLGFGVPGVRGGNLP